MRRRLEIAAFWLLVALLVALTVLAVGGSFAGGVGADRLRLQEMQHGQHDQDEHAQRADHADPDDHDHDQPNATIHPALPRRQT